MSENKIIELTENIENEAIEITDAEKIKQESIAKEEDAINGFDDERVKLIPNPNFTDCQPLGTLLPINLANETVSTLSQYAEEGGLTDFVKQKLGYSSKIKVCKSFSSEQIDAVVMAIKSFEKGNALILGDMTGIGKGRVCAAIMRYAYMQNMIPIFITMQPYLFNDIYRDFNDIEGIGSSNSRVSIPPVPLILHKDGVIKKIDKNEPINNNQAFKQITKDNQTVYEYVEKGKPDSINEYARRITERIIATGSTDISLSEGFNCVMLPYFAYTMGKKQIVIDFLNTIAPNAYFIFDESHNAASKDESANILKRSLNFVQLSKGVLFSSATYAKNPNVFSLYVVKTSLRNAVPSLEVINDALKVGGENVSEYIASGLCKEGQMIRRERSFSKSAKVTEYVGMDRQVDSFGETTYLETDVISQQEFYNAAIGYFREIVKFVRSIPTQIAINQAIIRTASETFVSPRQVVQLADLSTLTQIFKEIDSTNATIREKNERILLEKRRWVQENTGKYIAKYDYDVISGYKATFRTNLFLAVKAKFTADKVIECLNTPVNYENIDGSKQYTPQKPVLAISNTGETIFNDLGLRVGDRVKNDFSLYLKSIYNRVFRGKVIYRKIDQTYLMTAVEMREAGEVYEDIEAIWEVNSSDFADQGEEIERIQSLLDEYNSGLPLSVIDYIRDRIESTRRSDIYFTDRGRKEAKYGSLNSPTYKFQEGTSRNYMLVKEANTDFWVLQKNNRFKSITSLFKGFNNGIYDVMLINVVASTGGSAQSSLKEGSDIRQRNMMFIQFELDINIEVQKRGRVNRTGQLNFPTYTYIISRIPAETRQYMMLRKKLRKLDANTSADQSASKENASIESYQGKEIHDIYNKYGFRVFQDLFISDSNNREYLSIYRNLGYIRATTEQANSTNEAEKLEYSIEKFNTFIRELEMYDCAFQQNFYDTMNDLYAVEKANLIARDEYEEELRAKNYKASLKQRVVRQLNSGNSIFSLPLFIADYYTIDNFVPLTKEQVDRKITEYSVWNNQQVSEREFHALFMEDFENQSLSEIDRVETRNQEDLNELEQNRVSFETQEDYDKALSKTQNRNEQRLLNTSAEIETLRWIYDFFIPKRPVIYNSVGQGQLKGIFLGYKFKYALTTEESPDFNFRYSNGSVKLQFAFTSGISTVSYSPKLSELVKESTITYTSETVNIDANFYKVVRDWERNLDRRRIRRFYTGNILTAIVQANIDVKNTKRGVVYGRGEQISEFFLSRFYNLDGSVTTAVELITTDVLNQRDTIQEMNQPLSISAANDRFVALCEQLPISTGDKIDINNPQVNNIFPIWNVATENVNEREICLLKRLKLINGVRKEIIEFEIIQSFIKRKISNGNYQFVARERGKDLYNVIYNNVDFINSFNDCITLFPAPNVVTISYALKVQKIKDKDGNVENKPNFSSFHIKKYLLSFDVTNAYSLSRMNDFLNALFELADVQFSFRSSVAEYFNISERDDLYSANQTTDSRNLTYPDGRYGYDFIRNVPDEIYEQIPKKLDRKADSLYGGVILSQPLSPQLLPSFVLKPKGIPNEIIVKISTSVLSGEAKIEFIRELERLADADKSPMEIGDYVRKYLTKRSVPIIYFFGDLRQEQYGTLFKEFIKGGNISELIFEKDEEKENQTEPQSVVDFDNAETLLLDILKII